MYESVHSVDNVYNMYNVLNVYNVYTVYSVYTGYDAYTVNNVYIVWNDARAILCDMLLSLSYAGVHGVMVAAAGFACALCASPK